MLLFCRLNSISLFLFLFSFLSPLYANVDKVNVTVKAKFYVPPCKINNENPITIDYGNVALQNVGKSIATGVLKTTSLVVQCGTGLTGKTFYIHALGDTVTTNDNNVLKTNGSNSNKLGVALFQGRGTTVPLIIGSGGTVAKNGYPIKEGLSSMSTGTGTLDITSVLYQYGSGALVAGDFIANAKMSITYD